MFNKIDDFELGKAIGVGQFGQVWLARHREEGFVCAIKIFDLSKIQDEAQVRNIRREIEIHLNMEHKNIIGMYGYFYDRNNLYCVLEYAGNGDLYGFINNETGNKDRSEKTVRKYVRDVAEALEYLHDQNIIHRDIKPENILIGCDGRAKLADFGWSVCDQEHRRATFCGTPDYLSPEICQKKSYSMAVDIWCLGILTYEMLAGAIPFKAEDKSIRSTKKAILEGEVSYPASFSTLVREFIAGCTEKDPAKRMTVKETLAHRWLSQ
ncbi:IPL1 [Enterospora canceri]|uniref:Aurora kinase n=1 Tax=Enterospora canceri TaxID=1081671 RepID=A0A1Y1S8B6_9MICR|nr:IPL1 [Enterospora canceri]